MSGDPSFDAARLGPNAPERAKVSVQIGPHPRNPGLLWIRISVLLDDGNPMHEELACAKGQPVLRVEYSVAGVDLRAERELLWRTIQAVYDNSAVADKLRDPKNVVELTDTELRISIFTLANQGDDLCRRLFSFPDGMEIVTSRPHIWDEKILVVLRDYFLHPRLIHFECDAPLFPWGFLYSHQIPLDGLAPETLRTQGFWGLRHEIQHKVPAIADALRLPARPRIIAAVCPTLEHSDRQEGSHPFDALDVEFIDDTPRLRQHLAAFDADCLYFMGHSSHDSTPVPSSSWLSLSGVQLTVTLLRQGSAPKFAREPVLVFLNGCCTGHFLDWDESTVAGYLVHRGDHRVCCITTVASVPESLAREFARRFWIHFLGSRETLGTSILEARLELLREYNNPLGLLYEIIGRIDTRLDKA